MKNLSYYIVALVWSILFLFGTLRAEQIESVAPHASALCLCEVTGVREIDFRPGDGPLVVEVDLDPKQKSGDIPKSLQIVKSPGGTPIELLGGQKEPSAPSIIQYDSLQRGKQYWLAFASKQDLKNHPQELVNWWPESTSSEISSTLREAVAKDFYGWKPQFEPDTGLTYGFRVSDDAKSWNVIVKKSGTELWTKRIDGEKSGIFTSWHLFSKKSFPDLKNADPDAGDYFLIAQTTTVLSHDNEFDVPEGKYFLRYGFVASSGKLAAAWILKPQSGEAMVKARLFDISSGRPKSDAIYDSMQTGGRALGLDQDSWLRRTDREFEPFSGKLLSEKTWHSGWIELSKNIRKSAWISLQDHKIWEGM